ncbi:MAG: pirin family protein [Burkholderiaceae bacterium]|jgi:redox-sensitive bicupin YhaK (pirin superfamily)|nr:pirin family protein [Burkholderiaceae bacterium]
MTQTVRQARGLERLVRGQDTSDGAGVKLKRVLTHDLQQRLDPFLMLDAFGSDKPGDYIAGFPDHPHRGFETVTYMIAGRMRHRDSRGHEGLLENGGVQWMTAGRGLVHSEMPEQEEGVMEGFQLWLNLPSQRKMCDPWYRDIPSSEIPEVHLPGGLRVRVIAGVCAGVAGAISRDQTEPLYLDMHFDGANDAAALSHALPAHHNALVYPYRGALEVCGATGSQSVPQAHMGVLRNEGDGLVLRAASGTRAIVIAGQPLKEPIAQYGPFVMNTREELMQAVDDFRAGKFA